MQLAAISEGGEEVSVDVCEEGLVAVVRNR